MLHKLYWVEAKVGAIVSLYHIRLCIIIYVVQGTNKCFKVGATVSGT